MQQQSSSEAFAWVFAIAAASLAAVLAYFYRVCSNTACQVCPVCTPTTTPEGPVAPVTPAVTPPEPTPAAPGPVSQPAPAGCTQYEGAPYWFCQGKDSSQNDISQIKGQTNDQLIAACSAKAECAGFNTNGWLKSLILHPTKWGTWADLTPGNENKGLFIKQPWTIPNA